MVIGTEKLSQITQIITDFLLVNQNQILLLSLLRAALFGEKPDASAFAGADWKRILHLADVQTVSSLMLDGMELLPPSVIGLSLDDKLVRFGKMQRMECINQLHRSVIVKIDKALRVEGIHAVFMKGQTVALRYPKALHRTPGDIDFVVAPEDFEKAMVVMEKIGKVNHGLVHEHHGMAWVDGVAVEPHYKVHNYQRPSTDRAMQGIFSSVFPSELAHADIDGYGVPVFPPTFESVFLISHMVNHVYEEGLGLRQVIDYAMFLHACADKIDWMQHHEWLYRMRMERAWRIFTCVCVTYLGLPLPSQVEPFSYNERKWAAMLMDDIMRVGNFGRGEYVFLHRGMLDAFRNYCWVAKRCLRLGFVCPSEARWWIISKAKRFFWKRNVEKGMKG